MRADRGHRWRQLAAVAAALAASCASAGQAGTLTSHPVTIALEGAEPVQLEAGQLLVPENRSRAESSAISIAYYRLRSTAAQALSPVFVLAGGPGESALGDFEEDSEFRAIVLFLRSLTDVVLLDQRGAGRSRPLLDCPYHVEWPASRLLVSEDYARELRTQAKRCHDGWVARGIDLAAYNTIENSADVDALRAALGYQRISLLAGSYGSHLSLAILRRYPRSVDRAVLWGIEGPDHTWDLPSQTLEALARLAAAAERSAALEPYLPEGGLLAALETVEQRLERAPVDIVVQRDGRPVQVTLGRFDVQRLALHGAHDRTNLEWPAHVIAMHRGDFRTAARAVLDDRAWPIASAMYFMMDCASGISPGRRASLEQDPAELYARQVLGDRNLAYSATCDIWDSPDLGPEFRENVRTDVPALIFQGSWDVSTPLPNAEEVAGGFARGSLIAVEGGSHFTLHDLLADWPPIRDLLARFLRGDEVQPPPRISLPVPGFPVPDSGAGAGEGP